MPLEDMAFEDRASKTPEDRAPYMPENRVSFDDGVPVMPDVRVLEVYVRASRTRQVRAL